MPNVITSTIGQEKLSRILFYNLYRPSQLWSDRQSTYVVWGSCCLIFSFLSCVFVLIDHCVVYPSSIYRFLLPHLYLQTCFSFYPAMSNNPKLMQKFTHLSPWYHYVALFGSCSFSLPIYLL